MSSWWNFQSQHYSVSLNFFDFIIVLELGGEHEPMSELCNKNNATNDNHTITTSGEIRVHSNCVLPIFTDEYVSG